MAAGKKTQRILILDGNTGGHSCQQLIDTIEGILSATGRFDTDVLAYPSRPVDDSELNAWRPRFSDYDAVVSTIEGGTLSEAAKADFEDFIASGGGVLVHHASVVAFEDWPAYNEILGLGWRHARSGLHVFLKEDGEIVYTTPWMGVGAGHSKEHPFQVKSRQPEHPIMKGMPDLWMHGRDEFYYGMRGPAKNLAILASAYAAKDQWGSGDHEPILWTTSYGKGRAVTTILGHCMGRSTRFDAVHCVGYQALIARSVEWAATGDVTIGVPEPFPTEDDVSIISPEEVVWPE